MLPSNFAPLISAEPELSTTYSLIERWILSHPADSWLAPNLLARDIPDLDVFLLAKALSLAVESGIFRIKYTVLTPAGVLAGDAFDDPRAIPDKLPDRFENFFETHEQPVVPIFVEGKRNIDAEKHSFSGKEGNKRSSLQHRPKVRTHTVLSRLLHWLWHAEARPCS